jgi:carbonic anhydrase
MTTTHHEGTGLSADEALKRLIEGNRRFLRSEPRSSAFRLETLTDLAKAQRPYATVLGCSDSRVPPEWIFDTGPGELFVIRIAGNVFSPEIAGTLQYAGSYLNTPLFVILGHEGCGAIAAALLTKQKGEQFRSRVQLLLASILPGLPDFDPTLSPEEQTARAVESNVRWTVRQILNSPEGQARMAQGRMKVVGAVYAIETGRVRVLPADETR